MPYPVHTILTKFPALFLQNTAGIGLHFQYTRRSTAGQDFFSQNLALCCKKTQQQGSDLLLCCFYSLQTATSATP